MTDVEPTKTTDWLAALRPTDLRPPRYIKAPEHFPQILKAFGPLSPHEFRRAVLAIDEIVTGYLSAQKRKPPMKFDEADKLLAPIENYFRKSLTVWERAARLYPAIFTGLIIAASPEKRKASEFDWEKIDPASTLKNALLGVRALRDRNVYRAATGQPSQKRPERELLWEPAEIYFSERVVGDCLRAGPTHAVIASKFLPFPGRTSPRRLMSALDGSLARLGLKTIDLYYVHYPLLLIDVGVFVEGLVEAVKSGKARAVGVANFNADQMRRIADHLARAGVPLAANQVNYSLLRRAAETNGVLEACCELDVALVAYFPLASGRLTQPSDSMGAKALLTCLADIARAHDAGISQVALNWLLARDSHVIPIPGATKPYHARANIDALGWRLSETEFDAIDRASAKSGT